MSSLPVLHLDSSLIISTNHTEGSERASKQILRNVSTACAAPQFAVVMAAGRLRAEKAERKRDTKRKKGLQKLNDINVSR